MASVQYVGRLTIANGGTASNVLSRDVFGRCRSLCLVSRDAALTAAVTLQTATAEDTPAYKTVQSPPGTDVALAANKAVVVLAVPFNAIRVLSAGAEGAERNWDVWGEVGE